MQTTVRLVLGVFALSVSSSVALGQPAEPADQPAEPTPPEEPVPAAPAEPAPPVPAVPAEPAPKAVPAAPQPPAPEGRVPSRIEEGIADRVTLRIHVINTRNTYEAIDFDIYSVATRELVAEGRSTNEAVGEPAAAFDLVVGDYKIVRAGEPFESRVDFATVNAYDDTDFLIVVDHQTLAFRGAGIVTDELPEGVELAGIRMALNVGGNLFLDHRRRVIGGTNGVNALIGLFGNFGLVFDRGDHFLTVSSNLQLNLRDPRVAAVASTTDYFEGSALYAYNLGNPYVGPYARAGFKTKVFPGYLYLKDEDAPTGQVEVHRLDGTIDNFVFGGEANIDNLRIEVAKPFAPLILQEEIGGNLKAVDLDLRLISLSVATRLGFGFRQGITNGLLVPDGDEVGTPVILREVDDYSTLGPVVGADATVTVARWLFGRGSFGMLVPVTETEWAGDSFGNRLLIDFSGTAGFKFPVITQLLHASVDYTFRLQRDGYLTSYTMFDQTLMGRVSVQIF